MRRDPFEFRSRRARWDWRQAGFGPLAAAGRWFENGEIRLAILSLLAEEPRHGYDLMKTMGARWGSARTVSAGSIYPALQQLEDEGMIVSERKEERRVYRLTESGRTELKENAETVDDMWKRAAGYEEWARWISPEMVFMWTPLGAVLKSTMRAVKQSRGDQLRLHKVHAILDRARKELDDLRR